MKIRLDKFLADCGKGTRSQVKDYIKRCRVTVNGEVVKTGDLKVDTETDKVCFDDECLTFQRFVYYMLNKPSGVVSATTDDRDKTVIELITEDKPRDLFPVGRLDKDTEGLLLITNDGKLASSLLSPKKHVKKKYYAEIVRNECGGESAVNKNSDDKYELNAADMLVTDEIIRWFQEGIDIGDEKLTAPAELCVLAQDETAAEIEISITEGRYHQVKRMFHAVGLKVVYLKRLSMGGLAIDEGLELGEYRQLTDAEIDCLKRSN